MSQNERPLDIYGWADYAEQCIEESEEILNALYCIKATLVDPQISTRTAVEILPIYKNRQLKFHAPPRPKRHQPSILTDLTYTPIVRAMAKASPEKNSDWSKLSGYKEMMANASTIISELEDMYRFAISTMNYIENAQKILLLFAKFPDTKRTETPTICDLFLKLFEKYTLVVLMMSRLGAEHRCVAMCYIACFQSASGKVDVYGTKLCQFMAAIENPFNYVGESLTPVAEKCVLLITQWRQILDQRLTLSAETLKQMNILSLLRDTNKMVINEKDIKGINEAQESFNTISLAFLVFPNEFSKNNASMEALGKSFSYSTVVTIVNDEFLDFATEIEVMVKNNSKLSKLRSVVQGYLTASNEGFHEKRRELARNYLHQMHHLCTVDDILETRFDIILLNLAFAKNELFWYLMNENIKHAARKEHRTLDATITSLVWHIYHTRRILLDKELIIKSSVRAQISTVIIKDMIPCLTAAIKLCQDDSSLHSFIRKYQELLSDAENIERQPEALRQTGLRLELAISMSKKAAMNELITVVKWINLLNDLLKYLIDFEGAVNRVASLADIYYYQQEFQEHLKICIDNLFINMAQMKYLGIYTAVVTDFLSKAPKYWPEEFDRMVTISAIYAEENLYILSLLTGNLLHELSEIQSRKSTKPSIWGYFSVSIAGRILEDDSGGKKSPSLKIRIGGDDSRKGNENSPLRLDSSPTKGSLASFSSVELPTPKSMTKFSDIIGSPTEREINAAEMKLICSNLMYEIQNLGHVRIHNIELRPIQYLLDHLGTLVSDHLSALAHAGIENSAIDMKKPSSLMNELREYFNTLRHFDLYCSGKIGKMIKDSVEGQLDTERIQRLAQKHGLNMEMDVEKIKTLTKFSELPKNEQTLLAAYLLLFVQISGIRNFGIYSETHNGFVFKSGDLLLDWHEMSFLGRVFGTRAMKFIGRSLAEVSMPCLTKIRQALLDQREYLKMLESSLFAGAKIFENPTKMKVFKDLMGPVIVFGRVCEFRRLIAKSLSLNAKDHSELIIDFLGTAAALSRGRKAKAYEEKTQIELLNGVLPDDLIDDNVLTEVIQTALGQSQEDVSLWKFMPIMFAVLTCNLIFEDGSQSTYGGFENNGHCIVSTLIALTRCILQPMDSQTNRQQQIVGIYMSYIQNTIQLYTYLKRSMEKEKELVPKNINAPLEVLYRFTERVALADPNQKNPIQQKYIHLMWDSILSKVHGSTSVLAPDSKIRPPELKRKSSKFML